MKKLIFISFLFSLDLCAQNKAMIFWYGMGKGHLIPAERIAETLKNEFGKKSQDIEVKLVDLREFSISDPISEETGKRKYLDWVVKDSTSYTQYFEYYLEQSPQKIKSNFNLQRIANLLIKEKPNVIITVFWGAAHALYLLKEMHPEILKTPVALLYTDYGVRKYAFMVPTIEKIFYGSKQMVHDTIKKYPELSFFKNNFDYSGIPVDIQTINSLKKVSLESQREALGLDTDALIVTFARGGEVFLPMRALMEKTLNTAFPTNKDTQVVLLAGKETRDKQELEDFSRRYPGKVKIVGYVDNKTYLKYVNASDVFVTKPGGAGLTEAGLVGVPLVIIPGLGGQEEDNMREFVSNGMAANSRNDDETVENIKTLLFDSPSRGKMIVNQLRFFQGYDPGKIARWAFFAKSPSDWDALKVAIEDREKKVQTQKHEALDPINLKNWFNYLNDIALSDLSKDRSFQKLYTEKSQLYINKAIVNNREKINKYKKFIASFRNEPNRDLYTKKWKLFRAIILDNSLHINLHQTYNPPERRLLDQLTQELLQFLDTDVFAKDLGIYSIWEFRKGSLYTFLSEFYYLSRFYPKAQEYLSLALREFARNNTNESLIQLQADVYLRLKKPKFAIDFLNDYLRHNQDYDFVRINLAKILSDENKVPEALAHCRWLLEHRPPHTNSSLIPNHYFMIATIYMKNNLKREALDVLMKGMEAHPQSLVLISLAVRLINGDKFLKRDHEQVLAQLIEKYKVMKDVEIKKIENLPLLIEDAQTQGGEGILQP